jgi:phosphatidylinositol 4-kinase B
VFGLPDSARHEKITENVLPVTVLAGFVLASVGLPLLSQWAGPLAVAQARKSQPTGDVISESSSTQFKIARSQTVNGTSTRSRRQRDGSRTSSLHETKVSHADDQTQSPLTPSRSSSRINIGSTQAVANPGPTESKMSDARLSSSSLPLPEMRPPRTVTRPTTPLSARLPRPTESMSRRHSHHVKAVLSLAEMTTEQKSSLLRQNYFRTQTLFLSALEDISNRLVVVPKPARLSALRAELALIDRDLPAELDIPLLCPPTLVDGSPAKSRHHRIVRVNPAESTVLNSAEKVPFLLMIEILRDDFTFDPNSMDNQTLLSTLLSEQNNRRRLFDLSDALAMPAGERSNSLEHEKVDSVFEPTSGDLGSSPMLKAFDKDILDKKPGKLVRKPTPNGLTNLASESTPRDSIMSMSRSSSPGSLQKMAFSSHRNTHEQPDFSALASHMRTASQMLAQLEATSGKRPKHEVAAIRSKIIASMQSLEEQSFDLDDGQGPTFDMIIAKTSATSSVSEGDMDEYAAGNNSMAGAARMENDAMTGGVQKKGDRDDPSAAVFGEAWHVKKERIRKSSPYGWMKNWDLVSVIVKTGSDLRQEAFACQLIHVCHKIWVDAGVPVWVKLMQILVTGESSGLIETITNGVSLHSLKRSLTLSSNDSGVNTRRRFATLKDHWLKTFGKPDSEPYRSAVDAFKRSLAAYSMIQYVLQLKDRHNGNVLIDNEGHIIHIDFGFMLSNSPGSVGFEAAPFKLTQEYVDVLGGVGSQDFEDYKTLCKQAFQG